MQGCHNTKPHAESIVNYKDSVYKYIDIGDRVYAAKNGYESFENSLEYYDKAQAFADASQNNLLLAEAAFAKGRVYDAWNKLPQTTIELFDHAADLFYTVPSAFKRYLYVKHLLAHAYDKVNDSANTVNILEQMYNELHQADDTLLRQLPFTAEMALIATEVKNYKLASKILNDLSKRSWIKNDSDTYDYLNHYYLTKARLDIHHKKLIDSPYLDSLQHVYATAGNILDRMYYSGKLANLFAASGNYRQAYAMSELTKLHADSLNNAPDISSMESALLKSELLAEKRRVEYEASMRSVRMRIIIWLSAFLIIITILSIYLYRQKSRYLIQSKKLTAANKLLDEKVNQVEVLNKEIQHRVKNNLHMVFSLLQMQERKSTHEETIDTLQQAMLRIENIALLHNELVITNDNPDLSRHIKNLVSSAVKCLSSDKNIITHINVGASSIKRNHYLALSLILNEWVTNTIKYATPKDEVLQVNISIQSQSSQVIIEFADNGEVQEKKQEGLGTQIIKLLCRQISATLTVMPNNPYHYKLSLPGAQ